ncbi:MAG: oligosaccharide flippase family protein [Bacteroidales bacterium]|nr:oligosaccharide flippase family protein [Bacteroidales bacterium]
MKNPIKQLFGQTAVYGLGIVLPRLLNYLLLTPFYTRIFEKATYGIITELYAYVVFLLVILTYGMETGYFRYASNSKQKDKVYSTVISSLFVSSLLFILSVLFWSGPISSAIGYAAHPEYIKWLAVIVGVDAFTTIPFARIRLRNQPIKYALIRIAEVSVNIGLNLFFLHYCPRHTESEFVTMIYNKNVGVGYVLLSNLIASALKLILLVPEMLAAFRAVFDRKLFKEILRYSYPLLIAGLAGTINEALDRILLKHLIPLEQNPMEQLGIYGANYKLAVLMTLFVQMFKYAAEPFFFSKSGEKDAKKLYADVMMFFVVAGLFIFLLVNLYLDYFILFIGADFREGVEIVPVVLLANLVMGIFFNLSIWYKLTNKTHFGAVLVILGAIITVTVNMLFIPRYGYVASAWAHLFCYSTMVIISYLWSRKHYAIPYRTGRLMGYIFLALFIYLFSELFLQKTGGPANLWALLLLVVFSIVVVWGERSTFNQYKKGQD